MIDRVSAACGRRVAEVPVGFKYFVAGPGGRRFGFGGEESAGASFLRKDGTVWTTDKDGIILSLLAAEYRRDRQGPGPALPGTDRRGSARPCYERMDAPANAPSAEVAGPAVARTRSRPPPWPANRSSPSSPGAPATAPPSAG